MYIALLLSFFPLSTLAITIPLSTSGASFIDATGTKFNYAGVNWPGHMGAMIPEGLQYQSIASIVQSIKKLNMNVVRFTYSTQMVDEAITGTVDAKSGVLKALGEKNGAPIWAKIVEKNRFPEGVTRLQIFDKVAEELGKAGILVHLDNHISKAMWCCGGNDGNAWFGDRDFDTERWIRGWKFMANHTKSWPTLASYGLRNELRSPDGNANLKSTYNWDVWTRHVKNAAQTVNRENPNAIIFLSGLGFDTDFSIVTNGKFKKEEWPTKKTALELHRYDDKKNNIKECSGFASSLDRSGWGAMKLESSKAMPVVMTEFGFAQDGKAFQTPYAQCLKTYFKQNKAGWIYWVLSGSYYDRSGKQDSDEEWGLLKHDWSDVRDNRTISDYIMKLSR
ncbi:glycoside hydrolase [Microthyrium microscopicum]|uniref:Glycoside hydrolase n=1 Tax=Microthyrium microscopicum TaxID=703497 RepID=A0A6A6UD46_9PEZI|nr:glycoside hydrolase [Microthyrium microscopicum]